MSAKEEGANIEVKHGGPSCKIIVGNEAATITVDADLFVGKEGNAATLIANETKVIEHPKIGADFSPRSQLRSK